MKQVIFILGPIVIVLFLLISFTIGIKIAVIAVSVGCFVTFLIVKWVEYCVDNM